LSQNPGLAIFFSNCASWDFLLDKSKPVPDFLNPGQQL